MPRPSRRAQHEVAVAEIADDFESVGDGDIGDGAGGVRRHRRR